MTLHAAPKLTIARARELLAHAQRAREAKLTHLRQVLVAADELEALTQEIIDRRTAEELDEWRRP
jgi:hypothetical protein